MRKSAIARLEKAYDIIAQFENIVQKEIIDEQEVLPMTDGFESLGAALGLIGSVLADLGCEDTAEDGYPFRRLAVSAPDTRRRISEAYQACEMVQQNLKAESNLNEPVAYLESCLYSILDKTYRGDADAQNAIGNVLEICDCGIETIDTVEAVPEGDCEDQYVNPSGQKLHPRLPQLRKLFESLQPRYDPGKADKNAEEANDA